MWSMAAVSGTLKSPGMLFLLLKLDITSGVAESPIVLCPTVISRTIPFEIIWEKSRNSRINSNSNAAFESFEIAHSSFLKWSRSVSNNSSGNPSGKFLRWSMWTCLPHRQQKSLCAMQRAHLVQKIFAIIELRGGCSCSQWIFFLVPPALSMSFDFGIFPARRGTKRCGCYRMRIQF